MDYKETSKNGSSFFDVSLSIFHSAPFKGRSEVLRLAMKDCISLVIAESGALDPKDKTADGLFPKRAIQKSCYLNFRDGFFVTGFYIFSLC